MHSRLSSPAGHCCNNRHWARMPHTISFLAPVLQHCWTDSQADPTSKHTPLREALSNQSSPTGTDGSLYALAFQPIGGTDNVRLISKVRTYSRGRKSQVHGDCRSASYKYWK